jgi:hypothetical protein
MIGIIISTVWMAILLKRILWKREQRIQRIHPASMDMSSKIRDFEVEPRPTPDPSSLSNISNKDFQEVKFENIDI